MACTAASLMNSGVLKSGSPKLKLTTAIPCCCNSLLFRAMANVADSVNCVTIMDGVPALFSLLFIAMVLETNLVFLMVDWSGNREEIIVRTGFKTGLHFFLGQTC